MNDEAKSSLVISQDTNEVYGYLYDSLFIQSLLQHAESLPLTLKQRRKLDVPNEVKAPWPRFLDRLAFLCDSHCGGKSVIALGAEETAVEVVLWVAADPVYRDAQAAHLAEVVTLLTRSVSSNEDERASIMESITTESIARSQQKIHNYRQRLYKLYQQVEIDCIRHDHTNKDLLRELKKLFNPRYTHSELCSAAYAFRGSRYFALLEPNEPTCDDRWLRMRHFVGRLGYWHKAAKSIVNKAPDFARTLCRLRVEKIPNPEIWDRPQPKLHGSVEQVVLRVFPNYRDSPLCSALVRKASLSTNLLTWFHGLTLKSRPHVEVLLLNHFYHHRARFVKDIRYIGCSKPSCYCCSMYIGLHPLNVCPRPSHGNIWVQWCLPQPLYRETTGVDDESVNILRRMADESRQSTVDALTNGRSPPGQQFDSTTGMSTSVKSLVTAAA